MSDESFPEPEIHPMRSRVKFGGHIAVGSAVETAPATEVIWEAPIDEAAVVAPVIPEAITSSMGRRESSRVRYTSASTGPTELTPTSRVIYLDAKEPTITSSVGRRSDVTETDKPEDRGMDLATWDGDSDSATKNGSYAREFMRRLTTGEVDDYMKSGSPRKVVERITNEKGEVTHLRVGMPAKTESGWVTSKIQVKGLTERIATEPETGYSILAPIHKTE